MKKWEYFKTFVKNKEVASLFPTSPDTIQKICDRIDFSKDLVIVEFGPGEGSLTQGILNKLTENSVLIAIETNETLLQELNKIEDKRLKVVNDVAQNFETYLKEQEIEETDLIISGIPFSFLEKEEREDMIERVYKSLKTNGQFLVYQMSPLIKGILKKYFRSVELKVYFSYFVPLFIMEARK